jgi:hypothetical protein
VQMHTVPTLPPEERLSDGNPFICVFLSRSLSSASRFGPQKMNAFRAA